MRYVMKNGSLMAMVLLIIVAIAHLLRVLNGIPLVIGDVDIPQSVSIGAFVVTAYISLRIWKETR
jgi:hypothetical protein